MKIKPGAHAPVLHPAIHMACDIADGIWQTLYAEHATVTSLHDSTHSRFSLHYGSFGDIRCRAVDLRIKNLSPVQTVRVFTELKRLLGDAFDVVLETDHIHIEYDPAWPTDEA